MTPRRYDVILFDLDGTLADSLPLMRQIYFDFVASRGGLGREAEFEELNGKSLAEIVSLLKSRYGLASDDKTLLAEYRAAIAHRYLVETRLTPHVEQTLSRLISAEYQLGLVTSASEEVAQGFLRRHGLTGFFTHIVCAAPSTKGKPHPELYLAALRCFGIEANRVLVVEDAENGVAAARAAGIGFIQVRPGEGLANVAHELLGQTCRVMPLKATVKILIDDTASPAIDPALEREIEAIWTAENTRRGGKLTNGKLLAYVRHDENTIWGRFVDYKYYIAQRFKPELRGKLQATPLAVSGLTVSQHAVLLARRSAAVTSYSGFYELVPSGGLEQADFVGQLLTELKEEVGIDASEIMETTPMALIFDETDMVYDIAVAVKLKTSAAQLAPRLTPTPEYEKPLMMPREQLADFVAEHRSSFVPVSLAILEISGVVLFESGRNQ